MKLHESIEEFKNLIILTAEYTNIPQLAISKDYNIVTSEIKTFYEEGLNDLIYNDKKRNFDDVFRTFSEINSILKTISE